MRYAVTPLAFAVGSSALAIRHSEQCVQLQASGGASGTLGQLGDGQNRIGGGYGAACYCLDGNGGFTDTNGRGCILTPPTTQFQCDAGASPTNGFAIHGGSVTYNGDSTFYACPVNDQGEYNVYTKPVEGQPKCVKISLNTGASCGAGGQPSASQPAPQPPKGSQTGYPMPPKSSKPAPQPPKSTQPAPQPPKESKTGYPTPPKESKPAPQPPKSTQPAPQPPKSTQPAPQPPKESKTGYPTPPKETKPAPQPPKSTQPAPQPPKSTQPAPQPPKSTQPAPQPPKESQPAQPPSGKGDNCPADLNGHYEYPHLIVPVDSSKPSDAPGTSYNGKANGHVCSLFNFDIPYSYSGSTCTLVFLFPEQKDLETSSYTVSGHGGLEFSKCETTATQGTSWDNKGHCSHVGSVENAAPGNSYTIVSAPCAAGQAITYEMCATGDLSLEYFQDYNPSPIGAYIREC